LFCFFFLFFFALRRREFGHGLCSFGHGVLGQLTGKHQANSGLDLSARQSGLLVVSGKLSGFGGDALEDIVDKGVHDGHTLLRDTGVGVDLLQDLVNVGGVRFDSLLLFLSSGSGLLDRGGSLLGGLLGWSLGHFVKLIEYI
jgi:hypothetical protein